MATRPLAIQKDGTWYCYGWDLTKNICEVFGQNGYIRTAYSYTPYGSVTANGDITQPIQWSSEYADSELALVYYNYRHYNPMDGRWLGRDIMYTKNLYIYTSMPILKKDRFGLYILVNGRDIIKYVKHEATFLACLDDTKSYHIEQEFCCPKCVLIWLHGYNVNLNDAKKNFSAVEKSYKNAGGKCLVIGFAWNGNPVFHNKEQPILFRLAEGAAIQTGESIFRDFLLDLKTRCPKTKINVGTHSLGALVALTALKRSAKIDTLILTNPAVEDDVFEKGKAFEKVPDNVASVIISN